MTTELHDHISRRLERLLGDEIVSSAAVPRGYTAAGRWRLALRSGTSVFAKVGMTALTAEALRLERHAYEVLRAPFMPQVVAWQDDPLHPMMVLEDLSAACWPPPWPAELVDEVRRTLDAVHACRAPLRTFSEIHGGNERAWEMVSRNPDPFLSLRLTTHAWLDRALPDLIDASAAATLEGDEVVHLDVRSDNLCRASRGVVFIDWNWACLGNGALDTGFWLPSLAAEGGPTPDEILPGRPDVAAWVSGFFAVRAGLPPIPDAPHVRGVQRAQLTPALLWAARALNLPAPLPSS